MALITASGNEITDTSRATNTQGDGLLLDSSFGIYEAATNAVINGGFETNTTTWVTVSSTLSRITTDYKFGAACGQIVTGNATTNEGVYIPFTATVARWTVSAWVWGSGTIRLRLTDNTPTTTDTGGTITLSATKQRVTLTSAANLAAATYRLYIETNAQQNTTFYIDGVQAEARLFPTPYVQTDGGTATRAISYLTSTKMVDAVQGWVAASIRMPWNTSSRPTSVPYVLHIWESTYNYLSVFFISTNLLEIRQNYGNGNSNVTYKSYTWSPGDILTVIAAWSTTEIKVSVNGAAFTINTPQGPNASMQNLTATTMGIGATAQNTSPIDGDIKWFAVGNGTLTNTDATTINSFTNDPSFATWKLLNGGLALPTMAWRGNNVYYATSPSAMGLTGVGM